MIDKELLTASNYINSKKPFVVFKPDFNSIDATIPHLAYVLNKGLIKVAIHDYGNFLDTKMCIDILEQFKYINIKRETILWVEDISTLNNKCDFINKAIELLNNKYTIIFTCIKKHCYENLGIPTIEWDTYYPQSSRSFFDYIQPSSNTSVIKSPQDMHFRVYSNIVNELLYEFGRLPDITFMDNHNNISNINSIIGISTLDINKDLYCQIKTYNETYINHINIIDIILKGWTKKVKSSIIIE